MIKKEKMWSEKAGISYLEIAILIIATFAFAYIVYESSVPFSEEIEKLNKIDKQKPGFFSKLGKEFLKILTKPMLPAVNAEVNVVFSCCERTTTGAVCQDVIDPIDCQSGVQFAQSSKCEATSFCKLGCCIDDFEGTYDRNVPKILCQNRWEDDKNCNLLGAELGCCILGEATAYVTDDRCTRLAGLYGLEKNYNSNKNEAECFAIAAVQEYGACVFENFDNECIYTTEAECVAWTGSPNNFYKNYLCTHPELNTTCEKTEQTTCVDGKDEVYFLDSCGNIANIYDSSKINDIDYWESKVSKEDVCNPDSDNGNFNSTSCGNCNRFTGGICASAIKNNFNVDYGDYYCKDTSCEFQGEKYKNGESWCVYDGKIDDGDDIVGSRHWKYVCNQGQVQVEPCQDFRNELCVQANSFDINGTTIEFKNAACRPNNWRECIQLNSEKKVSECEEKLDCMIKKINFGKSFKFNVCVPRYPEGFDIANENGQQVADEICGLASRTCIVKYRQTMFGGCECYENCACEEVPFTDKMNDLCKSLGDCGGHINIVGVYSKNYKVSGSPNFVDIARLSAMVNPVPGQYADVGDLTEYLQAAGLMGTGTGAGGSEGGSSSSSPTGALMGLGAGVAGITFAAAAISLGSISAAGSFVAGSISIVSWGAWGNAFGHAAFGAGIGLMAGSMIAKMINAPPGMAIAIALSGAVLGGYIGYSLWMGEGMCIDVTTCAIMIGMFGLLIILGIGEKCKPKIVKFTCEPWQPPSGGSDCEKCNNNPLKPCSEYRCKSLGAACEVVNKGTEYELCIDENPNDVIPPVINPNPGVSSPNTTYQDIEENGFRITNLEGGCVDAYTDLVFGINTNEPAQCRFDVDEISFEEMAYSLGGNYYGYNHTTSFLLPDPSHGQSHGLNFTGETKIYVKCRDTHGNEAPVNSFYVIEMCVNQGPDTTAPRIRKTEPENQAFVGFNSTSKDVVIYTNEAADCKYSLSDKRYELMENLFVCENNYEDSTIFGYKCSTTLPINNTVNNFYIRCKDQPWLDAVNKSNGRNANLESYIYILKKPSSPLTIDWVEPSGDFEVPSVPVTIILRAHTSGGAENHECEYSFSGYNTMIQFFNTFSIIHKQELNLLSGQQRIYIRCKDETGDEARIETNFEITHDTVSPQITRVYNYGGSLRVLTNENAICGYSFRNCNFEFNENTTIMSGNAKEHDANWQADKTYYIKCIDTFNNRPSSCSIIIRPYNL